MHRRGALLTIFFLASCQAPRGPLVIKDPDPSIKIPAMHKAVRTHDLSKLHILVDQLCSDDAAVRFYAIKSLEDLTGKTFDYVYYLDEDVRKPAIARWRNWLAERDAATQPTTAASVSADPPGSTGGKP